MVRLNAAASSLNDVSGIGAAITFKPCFWSRRITGSQLEPSAHAPWTTTTVTFFEGGMAHFLSACSMRNCDDIGRARSAKSFHNLLRDKLARILKRKVAGIQQVKLRFWNIAQVCLGAFYSKE